MIKTFKPGTVLRFLHLHTNEVHEFTEIERLRDKTVYEVLLTGKFRPMLVLWQSIKKNASAGRENENTRVHYFVLYMTSKGHHKTMGKLLKVTDESFIDCGNYYEYGEGLRSKVCYAEKIPPEIWQQVMAELPETMKRFITLQEWQNVATQKCDMPEKSDGGK